MLSKASGRTVFSLDMLNHGSARRSERACYQEMALELHEAIEELAGGKAALIGWDCVFSRVFSRITASRGQFRLDFVSAFSSDYIM